MRANHGRAIATMPKSVGVSSRAKIDVAPIPIISLMGCEPKVIRLDCSDRRLRTASEAVKFKS
jgi:hypothetical protein